MGDKVKIIVRYCYCIWSFFGKYFLTVFEVHLEKIFHVDLSHVIDNIPIGITVKATKKQGIEGKFLII